MTTQTMPIMGGSLARSERPDPPGGAGGPGLTETTQEVCMDRLIEKVRERAGCDEAGHG